MRTVHWKREFRRSGRMRASSKTLAGGRRLLALDQYTDRPFRNWAGRKFSDMNVEFFPSKWTVEKWETCRYWGKKKKHVKFLFFFFRGTLEMITSYSCNALFCGFVLICRDALNLTGNTVMEATAGGHPLISVSEITWASCVSWMLFVQPKDFVRSDLDTCPCLSHHRDTM